jgi:hypothetical protein
MSFGSKSLPPPTADEIARWGAIKKSGCCICREEAGWSVPCEIHHMLSGGGLRISHRATVGLCPPHHRRVKERAFKAKWPNQELLTLQDQQIDWPLTIIPERRIRPAGKRPTERPSKRVPR